MKIKNILVVSLSCFIALLFSSYLGAVGYLGDFSAVGGAVFDGGSKDLSWSIAADSSGNIFITGVSSNGVAGADYFTIKYNSNGIMVASATFDGGPTDEAYGIAIDRNGNVFVTGYSSNGVNGIDAITLKYNNNLVLQESATFNAGQADWGNAICTDRNNNVFVAGVTKNSNNYDYLIIKYNNSLVFQSSMVYHGVTDDAGMGIAADSNGNIFVTGQSKNSSNNYDYLTLKYNNSLVYQKAIAYNGGSWINDYAAGIAINQNDEVFVTGYTDSGSNGDYVTLKYSNDLVLQSSATYNGKYNDKAYSVAVDTNNYVYVTGVSNNGSNEDCVTVTYRENLVFIATASYDGGFNDGGYSAACAGGHLYVTGYSWNTSNYDYRTLRYNIYTAPEAPIKAGSITVFSYPNPFTPSAGCTIKYILSAEVREVKLKIYDITGKLVRALDGGTSKGTHLVKWDGKDDGGNTIPSDVFLCNAQFTETSGKRVKKTFKMAGWAVK